MAGQRSPIPQLISQINSAPSFFIRNDVSQEPLRLPVLSPVFMSAEKKSSKFSRYQTTHDQSFSPTNRLHFPTEMSPIRMEVQRAKHSDFSESFIGGMYRDNRMGVSELRQKRIRKLNKKRQAIAQAQGKVLVELKRLEAIKMNQEFLNEEKRQRIVQQQAAIIIQRMVRRRLSWNALWFNIHRLVELDKVNKIKEVYISKLQFWILDCLERRAKYKAAQIEQEKYEAQQEDDMLNVDDWDLDNNDMGGPTREASRPQSKESNRNHHRPKSRDSSRPHSREHRDSSRPHSREHRDSSRPHSREKEGRVSLADTVVAVLPKWGEKLFGHVDHHVDEKACATKWLSNHHGHHGHHHHGHHGHHSSSHHNLLASSTSSTTEDGLIEVGELKEEYGEEGGGGGGDKSVSRNKDATPISRSDSFGSYNSDSQSRRSSQSCSSFSISESSFEPETVEETIKRYLDDETNEDKLHWVATLIQRNSRSMIYNKQYQRKKRAMLTLTWFLACYFETCPPRLQSKHNVSFPPFGPQIASEDSASLGLESFDEKVNNDEHDYEVDVVDEAIEFKHFNYDLLHQKSANVIQTIFREIRTIRTIKEEMIQTKLEAADRASKLAKKMLSSFPSDGPDFTASNHWLKNKSHYSNDNEQFYENRTSIPGPIDLSRSTRSAFWLNTEEPLNAGQRQSPLRATNIRGSSVSRMLSAGIKKT